MRQTDRQADRQADIMVTWSPPPTTWTVEQGLNFGSH